MTKIRKAIFAAAAVAVTFGAMAATSNADATYFYNYGHKFYKPAVCWLPVKVWNGYGYIHIKQKFYGSVCYNTHKKFYTYY